LIRYAAKLLFIYDPDPVTGSRSRRLREEQIVGFQARSASAAVTRAKAIGRAGQLHFDSGHQLRFAEVLQCMDLEFQDPSEGWYKFRRPSNPDQWARKAIPPESSLYVFTDKSQRRRVGEEGARARLEAERQADSGKSHRCMKIEAYCAS
jgi:hypothetical protein